jgi:hypothetical protein
VSHKERSQHKYCNRREKKRKEEKRREKKRKEKKGEAHINSV